MKSRQFFIPYSIGDLWIGRALCDIGAPIRVMPISLCKKLQLQDLQLTNVTVQLADHSIKHPMVLLDDGLIRVGKFIPCDFIVTDVDESSKVLPS